MWTWGRGVRISSLLLQTMWFSSLRFAAECEAAGSGGFHYLGVIFRTEEEVQPSGVVVRRERAQPQRRAEELGFSICPLAGGDDKRVFRPTPPRSGPR